MAWEDFIDPVTGDILLGDYRIPVDVWNAIYNFVVAVGHVPDPFQAGDSCWRLAFYLGICACESGFANLEGDAAVDAYSGPGQTCCDYWVCLTNIDCGSGQTAWDIARAHAPYGSYGAYLSHGWYQLYVCGQGSTYACQPAQLHDLGIHMSIALPHIQNAIGNFWYEGDIEQSVRTCAQESGHPGRVGDYDYRVTNIWNATVNIQADLYEFLTGGAPPSGLQVTLFLHTYYGGTSVVFVSDHPDFNSIGFNDDASSIQIEGLQPGQVVRLWEHTYYGGRSVDFTSEHPDFNLLDMGGGLSWNDQVSSIQIVGEGPGPTPYDPSPLPPIPEEHEMAAWPLPPLPFTIGEIGPLPELPPLVAAGGWAMPPFYSPMYSYSYSLGQRFDDGYVSYACAGTACGSGRMQAGGGGHRGIDLIADEGTPVYPAAGSVDPMAPSSMAAQVVAVEKGKQGQDTWSLGNYVILRHVPSLYANMIETCYAHLQYGSIPSVIRPGAWVSTNQRIGNVGNTGFSMGAHLHFDVRYANATGLCGGKVCWLAGERLTAAQYEPCCKYYNPEYLVPL